MSRRCALAFDRQCALSNLPAPEAEVRFHPTRKWRFDWAWRQQKVAVEVNGAIYVQGRHARGAGMEKDMEKLNEAQLAGWIVLQFTPRDIETGNALYWVSKALSVERLAWAGAERKDGAA